MNDIDLQYRVASLEDELKKVTERMEVAEKRLLGYSADILPIVPKSKKYISVIAHILVRDTIDRVIYGRGNWFDRDCNPITVDWWWDLPRVSHDKKGQ